MPILDFAPTLLSPTPASASDATSGTDAPAVRVRRSGLSIIELHDDMWRITGASGDVVGYVERFPSPQGLRFRAKRLLPRQGRFMIDGEFWSMDDAIACFR